MLAAGVPDRSICKAIGYCAVGTTELPSLKTEVAVARNYCVDCYNFFEDAKELYLGNYTEDEYKEMLLQQCEQASTYPAITELCKMVIEQYWPQIYSRYYRFTPDLLHVLLWTRMIGRMLEKHLIHSFFLPRLTS